MNHQQYWSGRQPARLWFAVVVAQAVALLALPAAAQTVTADAVLVFALEQGALAPTLLAIARQSGQTISFDTALVKGYAAPAVKGTMTARQALAVALTGSDLELAVTGNGVLTIARKPPHGAAARVSAALPAAPTELPAVTIEAWRQERGYAADSTRLASRTDTALLDLAKSVSTVSRELMDDQQSTSVADALRNVSGLTVSDMSNGPGGANIVVRGFGVNNAMSDGMVSYGPFAFSKPMIGIESVEVVKGPEGIIGGTAAKFGGVVNMVSKSPTAQSLRELQTTIDSQGKAQVGIDLNGALTDDRRWRGRLIAEARQDGDTDLGWQGGDNYYFAPSLAWKDGASNLVLGAELKQQTSSGGNYAYSTSNYLGRHLPTVSHAADDATDYHTRRLRISYRRALGADWQFGVRADYSQQNADGRFWQVTPSSYPIGAMPLSAMATRQRLDYRSRTMQADLGRRFTLGATTHQVLFGVDYFQGRNVLNYGLAYDQELVRVIAAGATVVLPSVASLPNSVSFVDNAIDQHAETGVLLQDQMTLGERWHLLATARRVSYKPQLTNTNMRMTRWLPGLGAVYKATPDISAYASYSQGVNNSQGYTSRDGAGLPPVQARQYEVGGKFAFDDQKLVLTTAFFHIRKTNVPMVDIDDPRFYHTTSGTLSRGLEVELKGRLTPALNVSVAYTYMVIRGDDGLPVPGQSRTQFSAWTSYRLAPRWTVGGGVVARSETFQNLTATENSLNPGQARVDTMLGYDGGRWTANLGIRNLGNRTLYGTNSTVAYVEVEPRRTATLSLSLKF